MAGNEGNEKIMRASHADRDQAINRLKAAFVQGRLSKDELATRAAQAFSARTYADLAALTADLAALTADLPAEPAAVPSQPVPARPRRPVHPGIKVGAGVIALIAAVFMMLVVLMGVAVMPVVAFAFIAVVFGVPAALVVCVPIVVVLKLEARRRNRSGGQLPPRQSPGTPGQAPRPAIGPPPIDRDHPAAEAGRPRPPAARHPAIACASH
jgi:Flp pilus assembly protein TadB